jgi:PTH1 family peptidyl-tRNA hydrolase
MADVVGIQLIAGLGNPGPAYSDTRHNAGAWLVERLAAQYQQTLQYSTKFHGLTAKIMVGEQLCHLLVPTTFMNLSGQSVSATANFYKIAPENILIVHDELDLAPGVVRLKFDGGHGGHNGLRDIFKAVDSKQFYRLRIGIGKPTGTEEVANYVLARPSKVDAELIEQSITNGLDFMPEIIAGKFAAVMKALHTEKS